MSKSICRCGVGAILRDMNGCVMLHVLGGLEVESYCPLAPQAKRRAKNRHTGKVFVEHFSMRLCSSDYRARESDSLRKCGLGEMVK